MRKLGVISMGVTGPIIREGDDIVKIATDSILNAVDVREDGIIGITESVIARAAGLYVTVDEIAEDVRKRLGENGRVALLSPIYSRNRFSMILKGIARAAKHIDLYMPAFDEVGNPRGVNPFTGVDIEKYYMDIIASEGGECEVYHDISDMLIDQGTLYINCCLHGYERILSRDNSQTFVKMISLANLCSDKNPDFGLLGTNKATEEKLKLFPTKKLAEEVCYGVQAAIKQRTGKHVHVLAFGDGCFKSPELPGLPGSSIWEFADPVACPGHTHGKLDGKPNEIKIKAFADDRFKDLTGAELEEAIKKVIKEKDNDLVGNMNAQGTTPRRFVDLLPSLMDLTTGSGDRGCCFAYVENYFTNYAS